MHSVHFLAVDKLKNSEECRGGPGQNENTALFVWRGRRSSVSGRDTAAFLSIGMSDHEESQVTTSSADRLLMTTTRALCLRR